MLFPVQGTCMNIYHQPPLDKSFFSLANKEKIQSASSHSLQISSRKRRNVVALCGSYVLVIRVSDMTSCLWPHAFTRVITDLGGAGWLPKGVAHKYICSGLWDA